MACLCSDISMEKSKFSTDMCWSNVCCRFFLHKSLGKNPGSWGFWSPRVERPNLSLFNKKMCTLHPSFHHCTKKLRIPWVWNPHVKMFTEKVQWIPQAVESTTVSKCALWMFFSSFLFLFLSFLFSFPLILHFKSAIWRTKGCNEFKCSVNMICALLTMIWNGKERMISDCDKAQHLTEQITIHSLKNIK